MRENRISYYRRDSPVQPTTAQCANFGGALGVVRKTAGKWQSACERVRTYALAKTEAKPCKRFERVAAEAHAKWQRLQGLRRGSSALCLPHLLKNCDKAASVTSEWIDDLADESENAGDRIIIWS